MVDRLAADPRAEFPDPRGFSSGDLSHMRAFAEARPIRQFSSGPLAKLPWGQNIELLAAKDPAARG